MEDRREEEGRRGEGRVALVGPVLVMAAWHDIIDFTYTMTFLSGLSRQMSCEQPEQGVHFPNLLLHS